MLLALPLKSPPYSPLQSLLNNYDHNCISIGLHQQLGDYVVDAVLSFSFTRWHRFAPYEHRAIQCPKVDSLLDTALQKFRNESSNWCPRLTESRLFAENLSANETHSAQCETGSKKTQNFEWFFGPGKCLLQLQKFDIYLDLFQFRFNYG